MPHPDGAAVFAADGAFEHEAKTRIAFRKGELLVRHGSKSERPNQGVITRLRTEAIEQTRLWCSSSTRSLIWSATSVA